MAWDDGLNPESAAYQIAASTNRNIRVIAGPGTGKSFAMKRRVARLLENGIAPRTILPVTFTRVAAEDLHRELVALGVPGCTNLNGVTLHSLALSILLRQNVLQTTGRSARPLNAFEVTPLEKDLAGNHGGVRAVRERIKAYESAWARLQHEQPGFVQDEADRRFERDLLDWLQFHGAMLIGEVIPILYQYLRNNPASPERYEYSHLLVDEYQDLNKAEQSTIAFLGEHADITIIGDDDQSIYSFKNAHPEGIREWTQSVANADDLTILECRRCPTRVVEMANSLISCNRNRDPRILEPMPENGQGSVSIRQYRSLSEEVLGVSDFVSELINNGTPPGDILILAQRNVIGTPIYNTLKERDVPVLSYYSETALDNFEAQRRLAYLKLLRNTDDRVALRWLLGCTSSTWLSNSYSRLRSYCEQHGYSPWETLVRLANNEFSLPYLGSLVESFRVIRDEVLALQAQFNA